MNVIHRVTTLNNLWRLPRRLQDAVLEYQRLRLNRIVDHAYRNVPFYQEKFEECGFRPGKLWGGDEITSLPLATKKELKEASWDQKTESRLRTEELLSFKTSGSTGFPFEMRRTPWENFLFHVLRWRIIRAYGLKASDHMLRIVRDAESQDRIPRSWRWSQSLGRYRRSRLSIALQPEEIVAALVKEKPDVISGYAGFLYLTAKALRTNNMPDVGAKFLVSGAETLLPKMREMVRQAFQAPVYDTYETLEVGPIACECPETGLYHILDDSVYLEVVKDGVPAKEGETGEAVVTGLHSYAMPFIRYPLNDLVTVGPASCPCGQPYSTLTSIQGRLNDFLIMPSGKKLHVGLIFHEMNETIPRVEQYQLVQVTRDRIILNLVVDPPLSPEEKQAFLTRFQGRLEPGVDFVIQYVDRIEYGPGMKFRVKRSLVDSFYDD
jgi:phenylacetate-CoA ligase